MKKIKYTPMFIMFLKNKTQKEGYSSQSYTTFL